SKDRPQPVSGRPSTAPTGGGDTAAAPGRCRCAGESPGRGTRTERTMGSILSSVGFVHLHVHSSYSLLESALTVTTLGKLAAADKMPALALTDTNNLFGGLEFSEKLKGLGIQPIAGV